MNRWNAIYTKSRHEKKVARRFEDKGIEYYLPLIRVVKTWSDRKKKVDEPLLKGYIFVKEISNFQIINETPGVVGVLKYNKRNAIVKQVEIDMLKSLIEHGYNIDLYTVQDGLKPGNRVEIMDGPLKGKKGELLTANKDHWFVVVFEESGISFKVQIPNKLLRISEDQKLDSWHHIS